MNKRSIKRWLPVAVNAIVATAILLFWFIPSNRKARHSVREAHTTEQQLNAKMAVLAHLPERQQALDSLVRSLRDFRTALRGTEEVDDVMRDLMDRARRADVSFWSLNPSVPALVTLEEMPDSLARLDLALLPVAFECHGDFLSVGRFLEAEQARGDFCQWERLAVSADLRKHGVRATGEILLFLLPDRTEEASS